MLHITRHQPVGVQHHRRLQQEGAFILIRGKTISHMYACFHNDFTVFVNFLMSTGCHLPKRKLGDMFLRCSCELEKDYSEL
jgi:hypothetical protein